MDNKLFDTLDRKIEKLLARLSSLEEDNGRLRGELAAARRAEKDAGDSRAAVERLKSELAAARRSEKNAGETRQELERLEREQETVRGRLEKLIATLEAADAARKV